MIVMPSKYRTVEVGMLMKMGSGYILKDYADTREVKKINKKYMENV